MNKTNTLDNMNNLNDVNTLDEMNMNISDDMNSLYNMDDFPFTYDTNISDVNFTTFEDFDSSSPFRYLYIRIIFGLLYGLVCLGCICGELCCRIFVL